MYDPVFDVSYQEATLEGYHLPSNRDAPRVVIVRDAYPIREMHERIPELCRRYVSDGRVDLICLEGAAGPIGAPGPRADLSELERAYPALSTAAMNALLIRPQGVRFWGIDAPELQTGAATAMTALRNARDACTRLRSELGLLLDAAQKLHYPPALAALRRSSLKLYGEDVSLSERVALCNSLVRDLGHNGTAFPQLEAMRDALASEHQLDFVHVERTRKMLVGKVIRLVSDIFKKGEGHEAYPTALRFCLDKFGICEEEISRSRELRGKTHVNAELDRWLTTWLAKEAARFRGTARSHTEFHGEFLELAHALGIPQTETGPLRAYYDYLDRAQTDVASLALMVQLEDVQWVLSGQLPDADSRELFEIEEALEDLYSAMILELTPTNAETIDFGLESACRMLGRLESLAKPKRCRLMNARWRALFARSSPKERAEAILPGPLAHAKTFYENNLARSKLMAKNSLTAMKSLSAIRAIVIVGGFHSDAVARAVDDEGGHGWAILCPKFKLVGRVDSPPNPPGDASR